MINISIKRESEFVAYSVDLEDVTLLEALQEIKTKQDASLAFSSGCRSSVCGSCSMRVNEREVLACSYKLQDGDKIEPLKNARVLRDLVVDLDDAYSFNAKAKAWLQEGMGISLTQENGQINEVQSDCILCSTCYSACPVYSVNKDFLGPFALTRVWKYVSDKREGEPKTKVDNAQLNGVWDCTLCNECTLVCPQNISSKADIEKLRFKSAQYGYMDPNFGGFDGFDGSPSF